MTGVYIARKQATTRHAIDAAYRVSSPPTNGGGDWRRGPRAAHSIGVEGSDSAPGPETYGFTNSEGLPAFVGQLVSATAAGAATAPAPGAAAAALMLAQACEARMLSFVEHHRWDQELLPTVETALRLIVLDHTPKHRDQALRLGAMARLKDLAQSGIHFCVGLDLEPYGSFVSGLYTPLGDLDLSIEGQASWRDDAGRPQQVTVDRMEREMKVKFLRAMASRIQAKRLSLGPVERILFARVPILKFKDTSGLDFDVAIGGSNALFKSAMLGLLAQYDWRFGALVRLVKAWARRFDVNDSANGSLNSFALTLMVVFHLQTRSPPVLPPLCDLCGMPPTADRPMQEGRYPDWRLLQLAGRKLCELRQADEQGAGSANSETLLELLASFFALYHGLASLGAAALVGDGISEAVPQQALEGVLKRVRVDTWAGRLRYERWDREGYLMSVEDPFDSTDNCARTVRAKEKAAQIAAAVAEGRSLLLHLDNASLFEEQLWQLFGPVAVRPIDAALQQPGAAVQWVRPVDLIIPPRIQTYTVGAIPCPAPVAHRRQRGGGKAGIVAAAEAAAVQRQLEALARDQQQGSAAAAAAAGMQKARVGEPPPPSGLAPPSPLHGDSAEGVAVLPGNGGLAGASSDSLAGTNSGAAVEEGTASSTMQLYCLILPEVVEEAARLAEIDRLAFEALAASAAAKKARKAAKRAAAEAAKESKAAERQRLREQRGRSQSKGSGGSRGGSRDGSRGGSRGGRSRSVSAAAAPLSTEAAVAAASANLGSLALSSSGSSARQQPVAQPAVSAPAAAPEPAQGMLQQRGSSGSSTAAALANIGAGAPAATEGLGAASEALPPGGATGGATAAAAEAPTALAAAQAAARAAGGGKGKGKGKGRAGKRSPGNMKAAVEEPKGRQMAQTEGSSLAAAPAVASQATAAASMALMGGRGGAGRGRQQPPQQQQQQAAGPGAVTAGRQPGRGRGRGRGQRAPGGDVASEARVLTVQRPAASSRPPQPPPPPPSGC